MSEARDPERKEPENILGLSTRELAGLSVDEITGNKTAITMIMHYYKQLVDENNALKNEKNTFETYVQAYQITKSNSATGSLLLALSNLLVGFGINLITSGSTAPGVATLLPGLALIGAGIYFTFFKEKT